MKDVTKTILLFSVILLVVTWFLITLCANTDSDFARANRYSGCVERLSENENLSYDEIKDACQYYLK